MKWRAAVGWLALACMAVALGLGAAWLEHAFAIPKIIVQVAWLLLFFVVMGFAAWAAWRYYRAIRDDDDWD